MTDKAALLFAKVSSVNAQIEGMKACGRHTDEQFYECQKTIEDAIYEFQKPYATCSHCEHVICDESTPCSARVKIDPNAFGHSSDAESDYLCKACEDKCASHTCEKCLHHNRLPGDVEHPGCVDCKHGIPFATSCNFMVRMDAPKAVQN